MIRWLNKNFLSLRAFYINTASLTPWIFVGFIVCLGYGVFAGLFIAPADYQQGDGFRIIYVHVPSAFASMLIYLIMAICAIITLIWRVKITAITMSCSAPIGTWFTVLTLITGSIWGKPMWGTWWIWDARLTSVLILLFIYLGFIALESAIDNIQKREQATSIITVVGILNIPIIHYSVIWWNTLHQGPTISKLSAPSIAPAMLYPLLAMIAAFILFYIFIVVIRIRNQILLREAESSWVRKVAITL